MILGNLYQLNSCNASKIYPSWNCTGSCLLHYCKPASTWKTTARTATVTARPPYPANVIGRPSTISSRGCCASTGIQPPYAHSILACCLKWQHTLTQSFRPISNFKETAGGSTTGPSGSRLHPAGPLIGKGWIPVSMPGLFPPRPAAQQFANSATGPAIVPPPVRGGSTSLLRGILYRYPHRGQHATSTPLTGHNHLSASHGIAGPADSRIRAGFATCVPRASPQVIATQTAGACNSGREAHQPCFLIQQSAPPSLVLRRTGQFRNILTNSV